VRLTPRAVQALRDHRKRQIEERLKHAGHCKTGLVFTSTVGTRLNRHSVFGRSFEPLLRRAGVRDIPFHALRYSFASLVLQSREHPKVIQEMLDPSRINATLDFYSHMVPDMQREAADRLDAMLS
jgi:integrase